MSSTPTLVLSGNGIKMRIGFKNGANHKIIAIGTSKAQTVSVNDKSRITYAA